MLIKGAGDLASGVAVRLYRAGAQVVMTETARPTAVRRTVSFSQAVYQGRTQVEGIRAQLAQGPQEALALIRRGVIPVLCDPQAACRLALQPHALVDAILAKRNTGTALSHAPVVVALGPGFTAGVDCHAVVETQRGHHLGRVYYAGSALPNTGVPGEIGGYSVERLLRAPCAGDFEPVKVIGDRVEAGETVAYVAGQPVISQIRGVLRGLLPQGCPVQAGMKSGDVDPRCQAEHCHSVSDKARSVAGGVLEALCRLGGLL